MGHRIRDVAAALTVGLWVFVLTPAPATGQAFWAKDTPKLPMAKTWVAQKAKLPPYSPPRTPDGVPDLQGVWGGAGGDGTSYLEDHEFVDVTTPAQESFVSDPPDGKVPYTPWAMTRRKEILAGLGRGWPGESGERLYSSPGSYCLESMPNVSFDGQEIVQKPGSVIMLNAVSLSRHSHRWASAYQPKREVLVRELAGPLGRRYAGRRGDQSQRQGVV